MYEASCAGVDVLSEIGKRDTSIYADARSRKTFDMPLIEQLRSYGYWKMDGELFIPDCYCRMDRGLVHFSGIIACSRTLSFEPGKDSSVVMYLGIGKQHIDYIEVTVTGKIPNIAEMVGCRGIGRMTDCIANSIEAVRFEFY
jgi:hypothetical protein